MATTYKQFKKARFKADGQHFDNEDDRRENKAKKKRPQASKSRYIQNSLLFPNQFDDI